MLCALTIFSQENTKNKSSFWKYYNERKVVLQDARKNAQTPTEKRAALKAVKQLERKKRTWDLQVNPDGTVATRSYEYDLLKLRPNTPLSAFERSEARGGGVTNWTPITSALRTDSTHCPFKFSGTGRVNVVRRLSATTYIAGTPMGGIWKTTDGGNTWTPKSDVVAKSGVTDIRVHPTTPNVIFAIMGDRNGEHCSSIGVLKSTNSGDSWATTGLVLAPTINYGYGNSNLGLNQDNPDEIIVVIDKKVYHSTNGGAKFDVTNNDFDDVNDIIFTNQFLLVCNTKGKIFKSTDKGKNFEEIYSYADKLGDKVKHITRFNEKIINGTIYILLPTKKNAKVLKFHKNEVLNAGKQNPIEPTELGGVMTDFDSQGGIYNAVLAVNPQDTTQIVACGVNGYYSNNHGATWSRKLDAYDAETSGQLYLHPDFHFAEFINNNTFLTANDGGIEIVTITSNVFENVNITGNLLCSQIYHCAIAPENGLDNVLLGLQDNGTFSKAPSVKNGAWVDVQTGDGFGQAINYNNTAIRYTQSYEGHLAKTTTAFAKDCFDSETLIQSKDENPFNTKLAMHNTNPDVLFSTFVNTKYTTNGKDFDDVDAGMFVGTVSYLEAYDDRLVIIGDDKQKICNYKDDVFSNIADLAKPVGITENFNSVSLQTKVKNTLFASVGGYLAGEKIYKSTDNGNTWLNISHNLPNVAVSKIVNMTARLGQYDEVLIAATNVGIYIKKGSTSTNWEVYGAALPFVLVNDIAINYISGKIYAATYGRGLWVADIENFSSNVSSKETEILASQYTTYPNPIAKNQVLNLKMPASEKALTYSICNYMGSALQEGTIAPQETNVMISLNEKMSSGVFLLTINGLEGSIYKKIIIQ